LLTPDQIDTIARQLDAAERTKVQIGHLSSAYPGMTIEDGYAISRAWVAMKMAQGRQVRGHKIGLTSRAMQLSSQIDERPGQVYDGKHSNLHPLFNKA